MSRASSNLVKVSMAAALLGLALHAETLSAATRGLLGWLLSFTPLDANLTDDLIRVGRIEAPWSEDCAGGSALAIYLALVLWKGWERPLDRGLLARLLAAPVVALFTNVGRIASILLYRSVFYPAQEPMELHFLFGFMWMLPVLPWATGGRLRLGNPRDFLELLRLSIVFALMIPLAEGLAGVWVSVSSMLSLALTRTESASNLSRVGLSFWFWAACGVLISLSLTESLWLPWLLMTPLSALRSRKALLLKVALLPGSIPLAANMAGVQVWLAAAMTLTFLHLTRSGPELGKTESREAISGLPLWRTSLATFLLILPFLQGVLSPRKLEAAAPPRGCLAQPLSGGVQQLWTPLQPSSLKVYWIAGDGSDRHHALATCMRYRGVELSKLPECEPVLTDGSTWYREFFLVGDELMKSYGDYLRATFMPGTPSGVHLVVRAPATAMDAEWFEQEASDIASQLQSLGAR